jgi:hypothetical protein
MASAEQRPSAAALRQALLAAADQDRARRATGRRVEPLPVEPEVYLEAGLDPAEWAERAADPGATVLVVLGRLAPELAARVSDVGFCLAGEGGGRQVWARWGQPPYSTRFDG